MTAQIAERLTYQGQAWSLCANPLDDYFAMGGERPPFHSWRSSAGCWWQRT